MGTGKHDYYSALGVKRNATSTEIRQAYLRLIQRCHPDKLGCKPGTKEWEQANAYSSILNDIYATLSEPESRREYDAQLDSSERSASTSPTGSATRNPGGASSDGPADQVLPVKQSWPIHDLPDSITAALNRLRSGAAGDDAFICSSSGSLLLIVGASAFTCLWVLALIGAWRGDGRQGFQIAALWGSLLGGLAVLCADRYLHFRKLPIKPTVLFTPFYLIISDTRKITWYRLPEVTAWEPTHHYTNGIYQHTSLKMLFGTVTASIRLARKDSVGRLMQFLQVGRLRTVEALRNHDVDFFRQQAIFSELPRSQPKSTSRSHRLLWSLLTSVIAVSFAVALLVATVKPHELAVEHSQVDEALSQRDSESPLPLPLLGVFYNRTDRPCLAPLKISTVSSATIYLVKLVDYDTSAEVGSVFLYGGQSVEVHVPLGTYQIRYATGKNWYGKDRLFGSRGSYMKAVKTFEFTEDAEGYSGYTLELYPQPSGNLRTKPIGISDF